MKTVLEIFSPLVLVWKCQRFLYIAIDVLHMVLLCGQGDKSREGYWWSLILSRVKWRSSICLGDVRVFYHCDLILIVSPCVYNILHNLLWSHIISKYVISLSPGIPVHILF